MDIRYQTIKNAFWSVFFSSLNKVVTVLGQLALTWLLLPKDVGIANWVQSVIAFTAILSVGGIGDVLLQRKKVNQESGQAFWLSGTFSLLTSLIIALIALINFFYKKNIDGNLLLILAVANLIGAPATILAADLKSKLNYKSIAFSQFIGGMVFTPLVIFLAWLGWGPYALIVPLIPKQIINMIIMYRQGASFRFEHPNWNTIRLLIYPSLTIAITGLLFGLQTQLPIFICGIYLGNQNTGFFSWGWMIANQLIFLLAINLKEILFPSFTYINHKPVLLNQVALKSAHILTAIVFIVCGTQALLFQDLMQLVLPSQWFPAIPLAIILSSGLIFRGFWVVGSAWLTANGKYQKLVIASTIQVVLNGILTWQGALMDQVIGASIGFALGTLIGSFTYMAWVYSSIFKGHLKKFIVPIVLNAGAWILCWRLSITTVLTIQLGLMFGFVILSALLWWKSDLGGGRLLMSTLMKRWMNNKI
jgi:PST family polysaccharide transporter